MPKKMAARNPFRGESSNKQRTTRGTKAMRSAVSLLARVLKCSSVDRTIYLKEVAEFLSIVKITPSEEFIVVHRIGVYLIFLSLFTPVLFAQELSFQSKPAFESLLKVRSVKKVLEDQEIVTNSAWEENGDFTFVDALQIRAPLSFVRPWVADYTIYPELTSAIEKFEYNPLTKNIEVRASAGGLTMHSYMTIDQKYRDRVAYHIVGGDMIGFKIEAFFWEKEGKTLAFARGVFPGAKKVLPSVVSVLFKPVSEIVIGVATKSFRRYIEDKYKQKKFK
jgi:hypothetical protein